MNAWPTLPEPVLKWHVCDGSGDDLPVHRANVVFQDDLGNIHSGRFFKLVKSAGLFQAHSSPQDVQFHAICEGSEVYEKNPRVVRWCYQPGSEG